LCAWPSSSWPRKSPAARPAQAHATSAWSALGRNWRAAARRDPSAWPQRSS
jgi:hypothetical protein